MAEAIAMEVVLISFPNQKMAPELLWHTDFARQITWPAPQSNGPMAYQSEIKSS